MPTANPKLGFQIDRLLTVRRLKSDLTVGSPQSPSKFRAVSLIAEAFEVQSLKLGRLRNQNFQAFVSRF